MKDFKDKVVAITGGATGIGFSFAKRFGEEGAKLVLSGRRENRLKEAVAKLEELGYEAKYFRCDVTEPQEVKSFADFAWKEFGKVDVLINNAGMMLPPKPFLETTLDDYRKIYEVNIFGVITGSREFAKRFIEQGTPAAIYNIGSENSLFNGVPMGAPYVSSKQTVLPITEALREETPDFVEVGLICPGFVRSELGDPENMKHAMDTDKYTSLAMEQIKAGEFFIVSHAYNIVRVTERYEQIKGAFEKYAPRYEGDDEFDIRTIFKKMGIIE
jgi:NAD(P)-dependent dehydrogenase (short-subunit alcohol dehydrogenase family)